MIFPLILGFSLICHCTKEIYFLPVFLCLFFCMSSGIAGASYIPAVQAALPRLLGAAAPSGSGARENRRQCLKVIFFSLCIICFILN